MWKGIAWAIPNSTSIMVNHQFSEYQFRWEERGSNPSPEKMLMSPWLVPVICTSQGTVISRVMFSHKLLFLWVKDQMSWVLHEIVGRWSLPCVHFFRRCICYMLSIWFLLVFRIRRKIILRKKKHVSVAVVLSQYHDVPSWLENCGESKCSSRVLVLLISSVWFCIQTHSVF